MPPTKTLAKQPAVLGFIAAIVLLTVSLMLTPAASAGTYPMYQCAAGVPSVSPGWSVFGNDTLADTVLSDTCSAGGSIGVYVFTEEHGGIVTENGHSGSQVGLQIDVPGSVPAVTKASCRSNSRSFNICQRG